MIDHRVTINGIDVQAMYTQRAVDGIFLPFLKKTAELKKEKGRRVLVMVAAPPGAGKTTLLSFLSRMSMETEGVSPVRVVGMDGFHRRQAYLLSHCTVRNGKRIPLVEVKGAPETFDLEKLTEAVKKVASGEKCLWPAYDRMLHDPVENAVTVDGDIVLLEGNYLLLDEEGWRDLKSFADYTVSIRAGEDLLRARLIDRRMKTGVDRAHATRFVDFSDMPNARLCLQKTLPADLRLSIGPDGDYRAD